MWLLAASAWLAACASEPPRGTSASADTAGGARDGGADGGAEGGIGGRSDASSEDGFGFDGLDAVETRDAGADSGVDVPAGWRCESAFALDDVCDCGCGASDPQCEASCAEPGCAAAGCEVCFAQDGAMRECTAPSAWTCDAQRYADGLHCDCGCGSADPDCAAQGCREPGCADDACDVRHGGEGRAIRPAAYTCAPSTFNALDGCDCGCGAVDPDCTFGCIGAACAGLGGCIEPGCRAPSCERCRLDDGELFECDFTCEHERLGDGTCDCGCGAFDPDCGELGCREPGCFANACERCEGEGQSLACERGACAASLLGDGVCDCGCRERDVDCAAQEACLAPGCSAPGCGRCHDLEGAIVACDDWSCSFEQQGAGDGCNCGCGAQDADCAAAEGCAEPGCRASGCVTCRAANAAPMSCMP